MGSIPPACPGSAALLPTARSTGSEPPTVKPLTTRDRRWHPSLFPALHSCSLGPISQIMQLPSKPRSQALLQGVNLAETHTNLFYFVHVPFSPGFCFLFLEMKEASVFIPPRTNTLYNRGKLSRIPGNPIFLTSSFINIQVS